MHFVRSCLVGRLAGGAGAALAATALAAASVVAGAAPAASAQGSPAPWDPPGHVLSPDTTFFVPPATIPGTAALDGGTAPGNDYLRQQPVFLAAGETAKADAMATLAMFPTAVWFTGGAATDSEAAIDANATANAAAVVAAARAAHQVAVVVVYDIPGRDCSQYSAGGAQSTAEYQGYINAIAAGVGSAKVVFIVEPDALSNLPDDCFGTSPANEAATLARFQQVRYAADTLEASDPNDLVYLDGGHAAWHGPGDNPGANDTLTPSTTTSYAKLGQAERLILGGVGDVQGFFENVSNFQSQSDSTLYGDWLAQCIAYVGAGGAAASCPGQYDASGLDFSAAHVAYVNGWYAANVPAGAPRPHFVIDTSRNGQGPWPGPTGPTIDGLAVGDPQTWCNPPGRGLGVAPTVRTGDPLLDADLWVKTPGESDGSCTRNQPSTNPYPLSDPVYDHLFANPDYVDPAAGVFWPYYALELLDRSNPSIPVSTPPASVPEAPLAVLLPAGGVAVLAAGALRRRRRVGVRAL